MCMRFLSGGIFLGEEEGIVDRILRSGERERDQLFRNNV